MWRLGTFSPTSEGCQHLTECITAARLSCLIFPHYKRRADRVSCSCTNSRPLAPSFFQTLTLPFSSPKKRISLKATMYTSVTTLLLTLSAIFASTNGVSLPGRKLALAKGMNHRIEIPRTLQEPSYNKRDSPSLLQRQPDTCAAGDNACPTGGCCEGPCCGDACCPDGYNCVFVGIKPGCCPVGTTCSGKSPSVSLTPHVRS